MNEIIDRAAQAIRNKIWVRDLEGDDPGTWEIISEDAKRVWREAARAAIEAMREPTDEMSTVAYAIETERYAVYYPQEDKCAVECWKAMVDEALGG